MFPPRRRAPPSLRHASLRIVLTHSLDYAYYELTGVPTRSTSTIRRSSFGFHNSTARTPSTAPDADLLLPGTTRRSSLDTSFCRRDDRNGTSSTHPAPRTTQRRVNSLPLSRNVYHAAIDTLATLPPPLRRLTRSSSGRQDVRRRLAFFAQIQNAVLLPLPIPHAFAAYTTSLWTSRALPYALAPPSFETPA